MRDTVLEGRDLNKCYRNACREVRPLQHVSFELNRGEILGVVGESGSGKSTLLRIISGIEKPDSGKLYHCGTEYTGQRPEKTGRFLRMIFQDAFGSFDPRMTMEKSLLEGSDPNSAARSDMLRVINEVGLSEELLSRRPGHLSGGQCQRMSIARAILGRAGILLCDEITSALDVTTQSQVIRLLTDIRDAEDISIVFVSHDLALVSMICDRIIVMRKGEIAEQGAAREVIGNPKSEYTKKLLSSIITV